MPPKGNTSTPDRGGGARRARGRGRGQASEASVAQILSSDALKIENDDSQSTLSGTPQADFSQPTPNIQNDFRDLNMNYDPLEIPQTVPEVESDFKDVVMDGLDPNTSPASQPTETPASTPLRPAQPAPILPPIAGEKVRKMSRFKPKAVRSDKKSLQELAEADRLKQQKMVDDQNRADGRAIRGLDFRGMRGRGRGDAMGRGRGVVTGGNGGLWGIAPEAEKGQAAPGSKKISVPSSGGGGGGGGGLSKSAKDKGKGEEGITYRSESKYGASRSGGSGSGGGGSGWGGTGGSSSRVVDDYIFEYPDHEGETASDISLINYPSDDEAPGRGGRSGRGGLKSQGLRPVRLDRVQHKPRKTMHIKGVDAEFKEEFNPMDQSLVEEPKPAKKEPGVDEVDLRLIKPSASATNEGITSKTSMDVDKLISSGPPSPADEKSTPKVNFKKTKMPAFQSAEDKEEWERSERDQQELAAEVMKMHPTLWKDVEGAEDPAKGGNTGRIYLFQFPPRIPTLYNPLTSEKPPLPGTRTGVKTDGDAQIVSSKIGVEEPIDLTGGKKKVSFAVPAKLEEREIQIKEEDLTEQPNIDDKQYITEEGRAGKMVIRKSGKIQIIWGGDNGNRFEVKKGVTNSFLSVPAVIETPLTRLTNVGAGRGSAVQATTQIGKATGMGKIMGKFVVSPAWDTMF
ncbi:RNA polymerase III RPC4-domain-containing protein [Calycina marina]|uniref:RNA polymerase III RPC4-domain-containing protein n=1 Tax=Calycina marina TaxID=1763456 RepID=A0A9P7Z511_9HELO|nr:RNA polymerase III RPC4-domain-containing protein [Calycina marina]